jgi:Zinc finger, ZZ type
MSYHFAVNLGVEKDGGRRSTLSFTAKATSLKCMAKIASKTISRQKSAPSVATQSAGSAADATVRKPETIVEAAQNVIVALDDLVTVAAASVEAAVSEASSKSVQAAKKASKESIQAAKKASKDSIQAAKNVTRESFRAAKQATRVVSLKQTRSSVRSAVQAYTGSTGSADMSPPAATKAEPAVAAEETQKQAAAPTEKRPLIHESHTCDSCLTTPIVGKRFHAVHLPDYDLCEACFDNYNGTDEFVEIVLGT